MAHSRLGPGVAGGWGGATHFSPSASAESAVTRLQSGVFAPRRGKGKRQWVVQSRSWSKLVPLGCQMD
eukprot:825262-Alexandrium_andersonii.AAC.1